MSSEQQDKSDFTFEEFLLLHQPQLQNSCVPQLYWETLFIKLKNEVFDAGTFFQVQCIQSADSDDEDDDTRNAWKVVVNSEDGIQCLDKRHIYLIDHAWSYRQHEARGYLENVPSLLDRMATLMEVRVEGREVKEVIDDILKEMWKFNQTYSIGSRLGTPEGLPVWYVMDEFGSRIQHSDMPTFKTAPFMYGIDKMAYTILWPVQDLQNGDEVTRDYASNNHHPLRRKAMLLPWIPCDFKDQSYELTDPPDSFFSDHILNESDHTTSGDIVPIPKDRKLRVCLDYGDAPPLTDDRFELVETGEEADILWTSKNFKDFQSLYNDGTYKFINQFPSEQCITVKDLLAAVCRRAGDGKVDPETLEGSPKWLPMTYNLNTELSQFVSYFQHREEKGLDNVWIVKPWNLSNSMDISVTDNIDQIIRLIETGPKIACKYVSDVATIRREDLAANVKVDLRFLVFLASVNPLRLYVYRPFSVRRGHKAYELTDFDDLLRHLTYVGFYEYKVYRPGMYTEEFIEPFLAENPDITWPPVEESIHQMFLEAFTAATSKPAPAGLGDCPLSRALYGIDVVLQWGKNDKGERTIEPKLCEINFSSDYISWKENYPDMLNTAFSALFFDDIEGREDQIKRLAP